jgi:hypothetical protein
MQHPVDYMIALEPEHSIVFRMFESGYKSPISKDDYATIVKQLFLACCANGLSIKSVKRLSQTIESPPDFLSYDVVSKLGSDKLRRIAATQEGHVQKWFNQEADILEIPEE